MLKITDLKFDIASLGDFHVADITPSYIYEKQINAEGKEQNVKTERQDGVRISVVLPSHKMEKLNVKVTNTNLIPLLENVESYVMQKIGFENLEVGCYMDFRTKEYKLKANATDILEVTE